MIIKSLLDCDLYKFFMMQVIFHNYTSVTAEYHYNLRNQCTFSKEEYEKIKNELKSLCTLKFNNNEIKYLRNTGYFKEDFLEFLQLFCLNYEQIIYTGQNSLFEFKGSWLTVMMFEIYTMQIISEVYFESRNIDEVYNEGERRLFEKIVSIIDLDDPNFKFVDFGGRRRFSLNWHDKVISKLKFLVPDNLVGTSNVYMAMKHEIKPIGTMAHEYIMGHQAIGCKLINSQKVALQVWANEYRGKLGIALTDTINMDAFLKDFDLYFCKLFDGCRHDSGDPYIWCEKLIKHYENMGIDPKTKTAVFSDGLNIPKAIKLFERFHNYINISFGIGTNLTNDLGLEPINHVIKMVRCNNQDVAKISDSQGKTMCLNKEYVNYLKSVFGVYYLKSVFEV